MASNQPKRRRHRRSFGAIRQLASGNYQASFKDLTGNNHVAPQTFKTREAADQFLATKQAEQIAEQEARKAGRWLLDFFAQRFHRHYLPRFYFTTQRPVKIL